MKNTAIGFAVGLLALVPVVTLASNNSTNNKNKDRTPPKIVSLHIESSNTNPAVAVVGDVVSISFTTNEKVETPVVLVNSKPLLLRPTNTAGNSWVATYTVANKTPKGKVAYAIAMEDMADNVYACTSPRISYLIPYCPPTDGSSVTVQDAPPPPTPDTTAPVIAAHDDVVAALPHVNSTTVAVTYTNPTATDNVDGAVAVSCTPASGSLFAIGSTTVTCNAQDAASNMAQSTFVVGVYAFVPQPVIIASQPIETTLCSPNWRDCYTGGESQILIPLGSGAQYADVLLAAATIAKQDDISGTGEFNMVDQAWALSIVCYLDADYTVPCPTWFTTAQTLTTTDYVHWTAAFNFLFDSTKFYQLAINDNGWAISAYGSATQPFWKLEGLTQ